jgi:hypothetical protein
MEQIMFTNETKSFAPWPYCTFEDKNQCYVFKLNIKLAPGMFSQNEIWRNIIKVKKLHMPWFIRYLH